MFLTLLKRALFSSRHGYDQVDSEERLLYSPDSDLSPQLGSPHHGELSEKAGAGECNGDTRRLIDPRIISDATLGLSDGLTVPFALTAGLSGFGTTKVVIFGGLAELIAGAISMGLGGYLGAKSEAEAYESTVRSTHVLLRKDSERIPRILAETFQPYLRPGHSADAIIASLDLSPENLLTFLMRFHHSLPDPPANRAYISAVTIAISYFLGGLIPLLPYMFVDNNTTGLWISCVVMIFALFGFGLGKRILVEEEGWSGSGVKRKAIRSGVEMVLLGSAAAGAAVLMVRMFNTGSEA